MPRKMRPSSSSTKSGLASHLRKLGLNPTVTVNPKVVKRFRKTLVSKLAKESFKGLGRSIEDDVIKEATGKDFSKMGKSNREKIVSPIRDEARELNLKRDKMKKKPRHQLGLG